MESTPTEPAVAQPEGSAAEPSSDAGTRSTRTRMDSVRLLTAMLLAAAAIVHLGYAPHHLSDDWAHGWFFIVIGVAELGLAALLLSRPRRWVWAATIVLNVGIVATWTVSRTVGLPFGPQALRSEDASAPDITCVALELATIALSVAALAFGRWLAQTPRDRVSWRATTAVLGVVALIAGAVMLTPSYTSAHEAAGHDHGSTTLTGTTPCELAGAPASPGQTQTDAEGHSHRGPTEQVTLTETERLQLIEQQKLAREAAARYPTVADAEKAGYRMSVAYVPCIGAHYTNSIYALKFDPSHPSELLYDGTAPNSRIVGLSYLVYSPTGAPQGFAGSNDLWHQHNSNGGLCLRNGVVVGGEALNAEECAARGGRKVANDNIWMLHDWVVPGWECSWGVFAGECPELGGRTGASAWADPAPDSAGAQLAGLTAQKPS